MVTGNIQLPRFGFAHVPELPEALVYAPETDAGDPQADASPTCKFQVVSMVAALSRTLSDAELRFDLNYVVNVQARGSA
jgi:hypothetical protein